MVDPISIATTIFSLVIQARNLLHDLQAAPAEFKKISSHLKSLVEVLEPFHAEFADTPNDKVPGNLGTQKQNELLRYIDKCDSIVKKVENLLQRYKSLKRNNTWDAWWWRKGGKQLTEALMDDLRDQVILVSMVLHKQEQQDISNVKHGVEVNRKDLRRIQEYLGLYKKIKFKQLISAVVFMGRLKASMGAKRMSGIRKPTRTPSFTRINSMPGSRRNSLPIIKPQPLRSSSRKRLVCWRIAQSGSIFAMHGAKQLDREQVQLAEMVKEYKSAPTSTVDANHHAVKRILRQREGYKFAAAKFETRDTTLIVFKRSN